MAPGDSLQTLRLLSMDGGGIYGLATALMLKGLCQRNASFLSEDDVWMFAGTSAGALNALLLANQTRPRDFVLSGELQQFWAQYSLFADYATPLEQWLSTTLGVIPWFARQPFRDVLQQYFGNSKLGDLKHKVLITTFDWSGGHRESWRPKIFYNFPDNEVDRSKLIVDVAFAAGAPPGMREITHGLGDGGIYVPNPSVNAIAKTLNYYSPGELDNVLPILFHMSNALEAQSEFLHQLRSAPTPDYGPLWSRFQSALAEQIGPLLQTTPANQEIANSLDKLASLTDVAPEALDASVLNELLCNEYLLVNATYQLYRTSSNHPDAQTDSRIAQLLNRAEASCNAVADVGAIEQAVIDQCQLATQAIALVIARSRAFQRIVLERIRLLSVGVCSVIPTLTEANYNAGLQNFFALPTNPPQLNVWTPGTFIGLDAPSEEAIYISRQMIQRRFHRLSPELFGPPGMQLWPTIPATLVAKNPLWHPVMIQTIENTVATSPKASDGLRSAEEFLRNRWYSVTP